MFLREYFRPVANTTRKAKSKAAEAAAAIMPSIYIPGECTSQLCTTHITRVLCE